MINMGQYSYRTDLQCIKFFWAIFMINIGDAVRATGTAGGKQERGWPIPENS